MNRGQSILGLDLTLSLRAKRPSGEAPLKGIKRGNGLGSSDQKVFKVNSPIPVTSKVTFMLTVLKSHPCVLIV